MTVVDAIAGDVPPAALRRVPLAGSYGGMGLRQVALGPHAHAAFWAAHAANSARITRLAPALDVPAAYVQAFFDTMPALQLAKAGLAEAGFVSRQHVLHFK